MWFYYKSKQFKIIYTSVLIFILGLSISSFTLHKYYVSISKIEIDSEAGLLKMYTKVFVDDFEKLLKERYDVEIVNFKEITNTEKQYIESYLTRKVKLAINRDPVSINFLGCELENQELYLYYEAPLETVVKRLDIENTLLMDLYTRQQNTVDVTFLNKVKSIHLTLQNNKKTLFF